MDPINRGDWPLLMTYSDPLFGLEPPTSTVLPSSLMPNALILPTELVSKERSSVGVCDRLP